MSNLKLPKNYRYVEPRVCAFCKKLEETSRCARDPEESLVTLDSEEIYSHTCDRWEYHRKGLK